MPHEMPLSQYDDIEKKLKNKTFGGLTFQQFKFWRWNTVCNVSIHLSNSLFRKLGTNIFRLIPGTFSLVYKRWYRLIHFGDISIYRKNFGDIIVVYRYRFFFIHPTIEAMYMQCSKLWFQAVIFIPKASSIIKWKHTMHDVPCMVNAHWCATKL